MSEIVFREKRKRGRPKSGGVVRDKCVTLRLTVEEIDELDRLSRIAGKNRTDFIRDAIDSEKLRIDKDRNEKFAYLSGGYEEADYGYFDDYGGDFDEDF